MNRQNQKSPSPLLYVAGAAAVVLLAVVFLTWLFAMRTETVEPGNELVIVDKPYFFGSKGVRDETLKEGRILLWRTSDVVSIRKTPLAIQVKFDDLSSQDSYLLDFESTIQFQIVDARRIVSDFGAKDWFSNNVQRQYMAIVREAVKKQTMTNMMSNPDTSTTVDNDITRQVEQLIIDSKLPIRILGVTLGRAKPNDNVLAQINLTAQQLQRNKTLVAATEAELQRAKEQTAKAAADNAYRNAIGMSPEQFIQLEAIKAYAGACERSDRCVVTPGMGTNVLVGGK